MSWRLIDHDLPIVPVDRSPLVPVTTVPPIPRPLPIPKPIPPPLLVPVPEEENPGSLLFNEEDSPYYVREVDDDQYPSIEATLNVEPGEVPVVGGPTPTIVPPGSTLSSPSQPTMPLPLPLPVPSGR